jgi:Fe-S-cluster containining protein
LNQKVDAFFARVSERHGADMQCTTGCSDCCHVRLTITQVEAAAIRDLVASWPESWRRDLAPPQSLIQADGARETPDATHRGAETRPRCAALDAVGRCKIYEARPVVCRSHGVPIRLEQRGLPVVQACHRNFRRTVPDADCVLDQATLSATLLAVDALEGARAPGAGPAGDRIDLAGFLASVAAI